VPESLTAAQAAAVKDSVTGFMQTVAHDITHDGPAAWRKHFAEDPAFFMASDGHLVFPNRAAAPASIQDLARTLKHIELKWGDDLRVDPLTTGLAEYRDGRWQFRNAHWSVAVPASGAR